MCGEQGLIFFALFFLLGSPPRVRGTVAAIVEDGGRNRITPACAGNSAPRRWCSGRCWDHPRVCGEQLDRHHQGYRHHGSPPRVRGTVRRGGGYAPGQGITPACAGNSRGHRQPDRGNQDHPRVCGEQVPALMGKAMIEGSPPRVRGTDKGAI